MALNRDDQERSICCFNEWMNTQHSDLSKLLQAITTVSAAAAAATTTTTYDRYLNHLVQKNIKHFQEYTETRTCLALDTNHVSPFFAPSWCSSLENSLLWIGGCRPTQFFRLLYGSCSSGVESKLADFLQGIKNVNLGGDLTGQQLCLVNALHVKTVREEEKMTSRWASLQEELVDEPLAVLVSTTVRGGLGKESEVVAEKVVDEHERRLGSVLEAADKLRVMTLKELLSILTPMQGVVFLATWKKLNFCIHEWGKKRDHQHMVGAKKEK